MTRAITLTAEGPSCPVVCVHAPVRVPGAEEQLDSVDTPLAEPAWFPAEPDLSPPSLSMIFVASIVNSQSAKKWPERITRFAPCAFSISPRFPVRLGTEALLLTGSKRGVTGSVRLS